MTVPNSLWQYGTFLDMLDHWQALLAGALGFTAAIWAVVFTFGAERRKQERELTALRRSFGVEFRQCILAALGAHQSMKALSQSQHPITARAVESIVLLPKPVIYPACADRIGLLGAEAMDIVAMYGLLQAVRDSIARLQKHSTPDNIASVLVASTAQALIRVCTEGAAVLPRLKTQVARIDDRDAALAQLIGNEAASWEIIRGQWPELA
jgi:hypothetical protein